MLITTRQSVPFGAEVEIEAVILDRRLLGPLGAQRVRRLGGGGHRAQGRLAGYCAVTMSRQNVDLARRAYGAFNRRDWDAFLELMDPEIEIESRLVVMEGGYRGHEGLRRWWDDFLGAFPDYTVEIEELRDFGAVTLCHSRGWGHSAGSEAPLVDPFWQPIRWENGKCVWWRNCATEAEALEAAGLRT